MKAKLDAEELNLLTLAKEYSDERKARQLFESWRWPDGKPICPHCKHDEAYAITSNAKSKNQARPGLYCCSACRKTFTATVGTLLEGSHIPLSTWLVAIFILCSSKKSVSAKQLERMLGVTYKTAWFMAHRLRVAMTPDHATAPKLSGVVEVDETFVGGKGDRTTPAKYWGKTPVVALVERGGAARVKIVASVTQKNLGAVLHDCVSKDAVVNTDEHTAYARPLKQWKAHHTVVHSKAEYQRKQADGAIACTNTVESFFSLLKRGVYGSWHHVSPEHLPKYANEFAFRWSHRSVSDGERVQALIPGIEGKRLLYRQPAN